MAMPTVSCSTPGPSPPNSFKTPSQPLIQDLVSHTPSLNFALLFFMFSTTKAYPLLPGPPTPPTLPLMKYGQNLTLSDNRPMRVLACLRPFPPNTNTLLYKCSNLLSRLRPQYLLCLLPCNHPLSFRPPTLVSRSCRANARMS